MKVVNFTGPYQSKVEIEEPVVAGVIEDQWDVSGAAERKRLDVILEMIEKRLKLTASSIKAYSGGSMVVINRVLAKNQDRIAEYNASL